MLLRVAAKCLIPISQRFVDFLCWVSLARTDAMTQTTAQTTSNAVLLQICQVVLGSIFQAFFHLAAIRSWGPGAFQNWAESQLSSQMQSGKLGNRGLHQHFFFLCWWLLCCCGSCLSLTELKAIGDILRLGPWLLLCPNTRKPPVISCPYVDICLPLVCRTQEFWTFWTISLNNQRHTRHQHTAHQIGTTTITKKLLTKNPSVPAQPSHCHVSGTVAEGGGRNSRGPALSKKTLPNPHPVLKCFKLTQERKRKHIAVLD